MNGDEIDRADPALLVDLENVQLSHHNRDTDVLAKVIETISLEMDFEKVCGYATRTAMELIGADISALALPGMDGQLRFQYFWGLPPDIDKSQLPTISSGTMSAFKSGENIFVGDYPNFAGAVPGFINLGLRSGFSAPVRVGGTISGALTLGWLKPASMPGSDQIELIEAILRQIGIAYHRQLLMHQLSDSEADAVSLNERLRQVLAVSPAVIYSMYYDPTTPSAPLKTAFLSDNIEALLGYPAAFVASQPNQWATLVHPDDLPAATLENHPEAFAAGSFVRIYRMRHQAGHYIWIHDSLRIFKDADTQALQLVGAMIDISEQKQAENALQEAEGKYRCVVEQSMVGVYLIQDGRFKYVNPKLADIFGYTQEEVIAAPSMLDFCPAEDHHLILENFRKRLSGEVQSVQYPFRVRRKDGKMIDVEAHGAITHLNGKPTIIGMGIEITDRKAAEAELRRHRDNLQELVAEQTLGLRTAKDAAEKAMQEAKQAEERVRHLAHSDALTGLPNRVLLLDRLSQAMANANRHGRRLALLFIDLDRFKNINDSLGHFVGDKLLQEVAERLIRCVRHMDTVSRQGGDEFIILLSEIENADVVADIAEKLLAVVAAPYVIDGHGLSVTHSIGISIYPDDGENLETIIKKADTAMYKAKERGRNNYQFFTQEMSDSAIDRLSLENDLRRALENDEFELHYQPQIDLQTGEITGVEALIRWRHPDRGRLWPEHFIGLAEDSGLIVPIGKWVLRTACQQTRAWQMAGLSAVPVAVNLSAVQFRHRSFLQDVADTLQESELAPHNLKFELTESVLMPGADTTIVLLHALKNMGVQLSIDDFGTGYSSLNYLKRFPIDALKIDRTFVSDIPTDIDDAAITHAIISMGHSLRLRVVAEGVETEEQLKFLRAQECDEAQGNYISMPLPAAEIEAMLRQHWRFRLSAE